MKILFYIAAATIVIPGILHLNMGLSQLLHNNNPPPPPPNNPAGGPPTPGAQGRPGGGGGSSSGVFGLTGIFFTVAGIAEIFWGLPMARRWGTPWYIAGIVGTAVLIAIWAITRIPGNPITGTRGCRHQLEFMTRSFRQPLLQLQQQL